jgi:hypothetical protein
MGIHPAHEVVAIAAQSTLSKTQAQMASMLGQILAKTFIDENCPSRRPLTDIRYSESGITSRPPANEEKTESPE